ncbi:TIGR01212 family radical SAM protein [Candidatus Stoquefichus massiliensis]|uniref:TIGR01212 family radical SAM protein n=1 Tax=Candidatus Stoquefichus massiliensis TaxID=1470350 RepID=UPI0004826D95|nr:TIGR01212 family radical SAM protein [Candidatus Stoquefichus massiliensis]
MNQFPYTFDNKRYHTYNYFLKNKYQKKIAKVSLNAGFTCPNRDGTSGFGGCIFCSDKGSGDFAGNVYDSLQKQFADVSSIMRQKWPDCQFIAYFQANTNTYGSVERLKQTFEPFIHYPDVVGIAIATRPDCLSEEICDYLYELSQKCDLYIELGLQTIHDQTAQFINRGHDYQTFLDGLSRLRQRNIDVCVHIINGLPYETHEMMMETAKTVGQLDIQGLKIHNLFMLKNTVLHHIYQKEPFPILSRDEYIQLVVKQLAYIPDNVIIERLTGDAPLHDLVEPLWSIKKVTILNDIDKLMKEKDIYQGCLL